MRPSFYNDNANRYYPFVRGQNSIVPNSTIVDCRFALSLRAKSGYGPQHVGLTSVRRESDMLYFMFSLIYAGDEPVDFLEFRRSVDASPYAIQFADNYNDTASISDPCEITEFYTGQLVTGPLDELLELLPSDGELTGEAVVEPALIQQVSDTVAQSINLANADRTRWDTAEGCRNQCWNSPNQPIWVYKHCARGRIWFEEGYNTRIEQDAETNSLTIHASVGAGAGEPCQQVKVHPDEKPAPGSIFYEGGPACNEVIRSVNGIGGRLVDIRGGSGTRVTFHPQRHAITIDVHTQDLAVCLPPEDLGSLSEVGSLSVDDCACGPS